MCAGSPHLGNPSGPARDSNAAVIYKLTGAAVALCMRMAPASTVAEPRLAVAVAVCAPIAARPHLTVLGRGVGWVAVDKRPGMALPLREPVQAGDGVFQRLRNVAGSIEHDVSLAQRALDPLDGGVSGDAAAASGVAVVATDAAGAALLAQWEAQRRVVITAVVAVCPWPAPGDRLRSDRVLHELAQLGVTARIVDRADLRALVELEWPSGTLFDARRELRRLGVDVAHPGMRSGVPAPPRVLLHRRKVVLDGHPVRSEVPAVFAAWLHDQPVAVEAALPAAAEVMAPVLRAAPIDRATNCARVLDGQGTGWFVDALGDIVVATRYADLDAADPTAIERVRRACLPDCARIGQWTGARAVWLQLRPRQTNQVVDANRAGLSAVAPAWRADAEPPPYGDVCENGLWYRVFFDQGLATGLYLDQRDNRARVRQWASGRRVLNTFGYTGAFGVAAAAGGARRTVTIDAAAPALEVARENLERNGFADRERHDLIRGDVLQWLPKLARRGDRFDLVILDPPSHAKVKNRRWVAANDYPSLVEMALAALDPGGFLLACINDSRVDGAQLQQMVEAGARAAGARWATLEHLPPQCDFPAGRARSLVAVRAG